MAFPAPPSILLAFVVAAVFSLGTTEAARWQSRADAEGPYLVRAPEGNVREYINNARCAKVHNNHGPKGWRQRWRAMNIPNPADYWSTPIGPRSTFATRPEQVSDDLWTFLGGEAQLFLSFKDTQGSRKAVFAGMRCVAHTPITEPENITMEMAHVGVVVASVQGQAHVIATNNSIDESLDFLGAGWFPISLGMTPAVPGTVLVDAPWEERNFDNAPEVWRNFTFTDEATVSNELSMWSRKTLPEYAVVNGEEITRDMWFNMRPTRFYDEEQCLAFLDYENDQQSPEKETNPLVAVSGLFEGENVCDMENGTWTVLNQVASELRGSGNAVQFPLTTSEGVLLVALPAVWEFLTALTLMVVRVAYGKTKRVSRRQKVGWIALELGTILVALGEMSLLVHSTLEQLEWQPCWLGRWAGSTAILEDGANLTFLGTESDVLDVRADVIAVECSEDPGTDAKWAITIGVVLVFHFALLTLEFSYFTVPKVRDAVEVSVSRSMKSMSKRFGVRPGYVPDSGVDQGEVEGEILAADDAFRPEDDVIPPEVDISTEAGAAGGRQGRRSRRLIGSFLAADDAFRPEDDVIPPEVDISTEAGPAGGRQGRRSRRLIGSFPF